MGVKLVQGAYVYNDSYRDEWYIIINPIQLEPQHQTNWCWAASARMSSMNYTIPLISQEPVAVYVKLGIATPSPSTVQISNANTAAPVGETEQALEYILGANSAYSVWGYI